MCERHLGAIMRVSFEYEFGTLVWRGDDLLGEGGGVL